MHHSRLAAVIIDTQSPDVEPAATFWSAALAFDIEPANPKHPTYRGLKSPMSGPAVMVQAVDHPSRVHLDIETDDQEAEVKRLEALGATRIGWVKNWWVMQAPTGHRFCVVVPQRGPLTDENSHRWP